MSEGTKSFEYKKVPLKENLAEKDNVPPKYGFGVRHMQLGIFMLCLLMLFIARGHIGVTIVAMTVAPKEDIIILNRTLHDNTNMANILNDPLISNVIETPRNHEINNTSAAENSRNVEVRNNKEIYDWPKSIQEMILSSFFVGYTIMMFPIGALCQRYGGKLPLQIALFVNAIVSVITPWLTLWGGWKAVCFCRLLQGFAQAGTLPSIQALLATWVSVSERAVLSGCVHTGINIGTVLAYQLGGILGASRWGWPSMFYFVGAVCLIGLIILTIFGAASPLAHKSISEKERNYIMGTMNSDEIQVKPNIPWKSILTSRPLWGTMLTHSACNGAFVFCFNQFPSYIHYIFGMNVQDSGLLSSSPYIASIFTLLAYGLTSDYCTNKKYVTLRNARRISNSVAQIMFTVCLLLSSYTRNTTLGVACLITSMAMNMGTSIGWMVNYIDLAPNFSGILMALGNTLANLAVVLITVAVSYVLVDMVCIFNNNLYSINKTLQISC